jgi:predicted phage replisome organizer
MRERIKMYGIEWIKIYTWMFEDEKFKILDKMAKRDLIICIWLKLLMLAGKTNAKGVIFLDKNTPYTNQMFSVVFNRPLSAVKLSFKVLSDLKMIEINENNFIKIRNWEKYQNVESMERVRNLNRKRAERHREKVKANNTCIENQGIGESDSEEFKSRNNISENNINEVTFEKNSNVTVTQQKEKENKKKNEIENKKESMNNSAVDIDNEKESNNIMDFPKSNNNTRSEVICITKSKSLSHVQQKEKNEDEANELLNHYKKNSVNIIGLNLAVLKNCISVHGKDNAKSAIDKSLELNKPNIKYINGILKNWRREGYPTLDSSENSFKSGEIKPLRFNNFKPREYDYENLERALLGWD